MTSAGEFTCLLCGGDIRFFFNGRGWYVSRCNEHDNAPFCGTCHTCTAQLPTAELLQRCRERRAVFERFVEPLLRKRKRGDS